MAELEEALAIEELAPAFKRSVNSQLRNFTAGGLKCRLKRPHFVRANLRFLMKIVADAFIQAICFQKHRNNSCVPDIPRLCLKRFLISCKPLCQANKTLLDEKALQDWANETQWLGLDIVKAETLTKNTKCG